MTVGRERRVDRIARTRDDQAIVRIHRGRFDVIVHDDGGRDDLNRPTARRRVRNEHTLDRIHVVFWTGRCANARPVAVFEAIIAPIDRAARGRDLQ